MSTIIDEYLNSVESELRLETPAEKSEIITELANHIQDEVQELQNNGLREDEAVSTCIRFLGSAKTVARLIYEAHSQGTWQQALMASLPHMLFGLIFLLNWWKGIGPVLITLIAILSITVYGWWHRRTTWLFPWIGYSLLPVVIAGLSLLYLPKGLAWLAVIVYLPPALWLLFRIMSQTIKKDWLYLSLMLLPMPFIISWFVVTDWRYGFGPGSLISSGPHQAWIGFSFLALASGVISFIRIRKRWLKILVLFLAGAITLGLVYSYAWGSLSFINLLLLILLLVSIFLVPALLENGVRSGKWGKIFEHPPMS
ncbi:MAG: hypothetical protein PHU23_17775 [Dehalococcoidales bacterium]|nr:hypothetical protein [Dehalococcoidales bacterium]